jgi:hypothetical protein
VVFCFYIDVEGMDDAITKLLDRYPWLADGSQSSAPDIAPNPKVRRVGGTKKPDASATTDLDRASLEQRFKVLRKGGR